MVGWSWAADIAASLRTAADSPVLLMVPTREAADSPVLLMVPTREVVFTPGLAMALTPAIGRTIQATFRIIPDIIPGGVIAAAGDMEGGDIPGCRSDGMEAAAMRAGTTHLPPSPLRSMSILLLTTPMPMFPTTSS